MRTHKIATYLYDRIDDINQKAMEHGQLMQDSDCERYEWIRLCAEAIEQAERNIEGAEARYDRLGRRDEMRSDWNGGN